MNREDVKMEDYQAISAYAGADRSWHERVSTTCGIDKLLRFSALIASGAICAARYESKEEGMQWIKPGEFKCWSCKEWVSNIELGNADGFCPHCDAEIDTSDEPYTEEGED